MLSVSEYQEYSGVCLFLFLLCFVQGPAHRYGYFKAIAQRGREEGRGEGEREGEKQRDSDMDKNTEFFF